jgi:hypothetical protein
VSRKFVCSSCRSLKKVISGSTCAHVFVVDNVPHDYPPDEIEFLKKHDLFEDDSERKGRIRKTRRAQKDDLAKGLAEAIKDMADTGDTWKERLAARVPHPNRERRSQLPNDREHLFQRARAARVWREFKMACVGVWERTTNPLQPEPPAWARWEWGSQHGTHSADTLIARKRAREGAEDAAVWRIDGATRLLRAYRGLDRRFEQAMCPGWGLPWTSKPVRPKGSVARQQWRRRRAEARRMGIPIETFEERERLERRRQWRSSNEAHRKSRVTLDLLRSVHIELVWHELEIIVSSRREMNEWAIFRKEDQQDQPDPEGIGSRCPNA